MSILKSYLRNLTGAGARKATRAMDDLYKSSQTGLKVARKRVQRTKGEIGRSQKVVDDYENMSRADFAKKYNVGTNPSGKTNFVDRYMGNTERNYKNQKKKGIKIAKKRLKGEIDNVKDLRNRRREGMQNLADQRSSERLKTALTVGGTAAVPLYGVKKYGEARERKRYQEYESLEDLFEFAQMKLPLYKDMRTVFEKQHARRAKFIDFAKKKGLKGSAAEREGEKLYYAFLKKHNIKHDDGRFGTYVNQWTKGESA